MPLKRSGPAPKDALVWDLTLCARRALKRAARAERLGTQRREISGDGLETLPVANDTSIANSRFGSPDLQHPLERGTLSVSHDSLSLKYHDSNEHQRRLERAVTTGERGLNVPQGSVARASRRASELPALCGRGTSGSASGTVSATTLSSSRSQQNGALKSLTMARMRRIPTKQEALEKLRTSPFFVANAPPELGAYSMGGLYGGVRPQQTSGGSDASRPSSTVTSHGAAIHDSGDRKKDMREKTGPINWSVEDLASKYRNETNREKAYRVSVEAQALQVEMARKNVIIGAVHVVRHPLLVFCDKHILEENRRCLGRARMHGPPAPSQSCVSHKSEPRPNT